MNRPDVPTNRFELVGIDGANPLGFLAALGTLTTLCGAGENRARLCWIRRGTWLPVVEEVSAQSREALSNTIAQGLRGREVAHDAEARRANVQRAVSEAKSIAGKKQKEIKARRLPRKERLAVEMAELGPLQEQYERRRKKWLAALTDAVPFPELALGKRIDCSESEYRQLVAGLIDAADYGNRDALDLIAAFASDAVVKPNRNAVEPTAFCFITGSGHQHFLDTVRQLVERVTPERIHSALFEPWAYLDERLSMRWDPVEDKRYALLDNDPGPEGARTVWMANLLGYRALGLFSCSPRTRSLATTGWATIDDELTFSWPIWTVPASIDAIRSILHLQELVSREPDRVQLGARGIAAVYRARRIRVPPTGANYKLNFSPAKVV